MFRSNWPFKRTRHGIEVGLDDNERDLLKMLATHHGENLDSDDPDYRRLFPTAYHDDPQRDLEYQILARSELIDRRQSAIADFVTSIDAAILDDEQALIWMQVINQMRLVYGTRLNVSEDDERYDEMDPDEPGAAERAVLGYLSALLDGLVRASSGR